MNKLSCVLQEIDRETEGHEVHLVKASLNLNRASSKNEEEKRKKEKKGKESICSLGAPAPAENVAVAVECNPWNNTLIVHIEILQS